MRIAVCYTKPGPAGDELCQAFAEGIRAVGDEAVEVAGSEELDALAGCRALVQICEHSPTAYTHEGPKVEFRRRMIELAAAHGVRRIIVDTGFLSNKRLLPRGASCESDRYFSIGVDGIKRAGQYYNADSPADRWAALGVPLAPWRTAGRHVLIVGQMRFSSSTWHLDMLEWYVEVARRIRSLSPRPILLRAHPNQTLLPRIDVADFTVTTNDRLDDIGADLANAWCTVTKTSNAAVESIVAGVPVISDDPLCMAYDVAEHELSKLAAPRQPDRSAWCRNLAYAQWNIDEIRRGLPWQHLRRGLCGESAHTQRAVQSAHRAAS